MHRFGISILQEMQQINILWKEMVRRVAFDWSRVTKELKLQGSSRAKIRKWNCRELGKKVDNKWEPIIIECIVD